MRVGAVVEIAPDCTGALPADMIAEAYLASRSSPIALVLDPLVRRTDVDAVLDPVVAANRERRYGVVYLDAADERGVRGAVDRAKVTVALTDGFRDRCAARGISCVPWSIALARLAAADDARQVPLQYLPAAQIEQLVR